MLKWLLLRPPLPLQAASFFEAGLDANVLPSLVVQRVAETEQLVEGRAQLPD